MNSNQRWKFACLILILQTFFFKEGLALTVTCKTIFLNEQKIAKNWWDPIKDRETLIDEAYRLRSSSIKLGLQLERKMRKHFKTDSLFDLAFVEGYEKLEILKKYGDDLGENPGALFRRLNRDLRNGKTPRNAKMMVDALDLIPAQIDGDTPVYRGTRLPKDSIEHILQTREFKNDAFLSTSLNPFIATTFWGTGKIVPESVDVFMVIRGRSGKYIRPFVSGSLASEQEVLFPPGIRFKLQSYQKINALFIIELLEIIP